MTSETANLAELHWQHDLLGSIEVGLAVLDRDYNVQVWNQFMENHSSVLPSDIRGKSIFEFFGEIDKEWFKIKADPVFNLNSPAFIIWEQRPYLFKFATSRPITSASDFMYQNITLFPLASLTDQVEQICIVVYDVTDEALNKQGIETLNRKLEQMSRVDGLTSLFNRRFWEEQFTREFKRLNRSNLPAAAIMLDIDHFKAVNDNYGHPAGDFIIKTLAKIIKTAIRETDIAGRYGGEEFAIFLPETNQAHAKLVAERIRKLAEKYTPVYEGTEIKFTVSVGVAAFDQSYSDHIAWLEQADQALYQAKESGRNQVCII